jgi:hypothetical protein
MIEEAAAGKIRRLSTKLPEARPVSLLVQQDDQFETSKIKNSPIGTCSCCIEVERMVLLCFQPDYARDEARSSIKDPLMTRLD